MTLEEQILDDMVKGFAKGIRPKCNTFGRWIEDVFCGCAVTAIYYADNDLPAPKDRALTDLMLDHMIQKYGLNRVDVTALIDGFDNMTYSSYRGNAFYTLGQKARAIAELI